jgi:hypothetical protein
LDSTESTFDTSRQGSRQHRLSHARHIFDQDVPARQQAGQEQIHRAGMSEENALDILAKPVDQLVGHESPGSMLPASSRLADEPVSAVSRSRRILASRGMGYQP